MIRNISLFLFSFFISSMAFADVQLCLEDATNAQLLKELRFRLNAPVVGSDVAVPTVTCFGAGMTVLLLDKNGDETSETMSTVSTSDCDFYAKQITDKLNNKVVGSTVVASCRGATLNRLHLKGDGSIKNLQSLSFVNSTKCKIKATEINSN